MKVRRSRRGAHLPSVRPQSGEGAEPRPVSASPHSLHDPQPYEAWDAGTGSGAAVGSDPGRQSVTPTLAIELQPDCLVFYTGPKGATHGR